MRKELISPRVGTWAWEVRPNKVFADPLMSMYFGMEADEGASGPPIERFADAIHEDDREAVRRGVRRAIRRQVPFIQSYRVKTLDGEERLILAEGRCFLDARRRPRLYPGHIIDIGDYVGGNPSLQDLMDHLGIAALKAQRLRLDVVQYLVSMASLELSLQIKGQGEITNYLN